jgi:hypothetical protein
MVSPRASLSSPLASARRSREGFELARMGSVALLHALSLPLEMCHCRCDEDSLGGTLAREPLSWLFEAAPLQGRASASLADVRFYLASLEALRPCACAQRRFRLQPTASQMSVGQSMLGARRAVASLRAVAVASPAWSAVAAAASPAQCQVSVMLCLA